MIINYASYFNIQMFSIFDEKTTDIYFYLGGLESIIEEEYNKEYEEYDKEYEEYENYNNKEKDKYYDELMDYYDSYYDDYNDY